MKPVKICDHGPYKSEAEALASAPYAVARENRNNPGQWWAYWPPAQVVARREAAADGRTTNEPSPNRVIGAADFAGDLSPRPWRVKGLIPLAAEFVVVYGASGDGKTFFLIDVANAIQQGRPWNGRPVKRGRVIYLCAEGAGDFKYRYHAEAGVHGLKLHELPSVIDNAPDLFDERQARDVLAQIQAAGGCDALFIDTLAATMTGDENGSDMGRYVRNVKMIQRALNCQVFCIHHNGKQASKGARGHSSLKAAADVMVEITKDETTEVCTALVEKQKGGAGGARYFFKLKPIKLGRDSEGEDFGSCVVEYMNEGSKPKAAKLTKAQAATNKIVRKLSPTFEGVDIDAVVDGVLEGKGYTDGEIKSYHRRDARKTLQELKGLGLVWIDGDTCGQGGLKPRADLTSEDWLK